MICEASILAEVHSSDAGKVFLQYRTIDGSLGKLAIGKEWFGKVPTTVGSEVVLTGKGNDKSIEEFNKSISALRACATPGAAGLCSANVSIFGWRESEGLSEGSQARRCAVLMGCGHSDVLFL